MGDPAVAQLDELLAILDDEMVEARIVGFDVRGETLVLRIAAEGTEVTISCHGPRRWVIEDESIWRGQLTRDHPALLPFVEARADLFFTGRPGDPHRLIARLREAHEAVAPFIPADETFAQSLSVAQLEGGHGHLASGPRSLMERYAEVARDEGLRPKVIAGEARQADLAVLDLGDSYVVAESFESEGDLRHLLEA